MVSINGGAGSIVDGMEFRYLGECHCNDVIAPIFPRRRSFVFTPAPAVPPCMNAGGYRTIASPAENYLLTPAKAQLTNRDVLTIH